MESHHKSLLLILPLLVVGWAITKLYAGLAGPLSNVPGPFISRFTYWVLKFYIVTGRRTQYIHGLHKKYGPVVRISPWEVSIADLSATKEIHSITHGFLKSPWYAKFAKSEASIMFTMTDPKEHSARRRLLANELSESSLRQHGHEKLVFEKASFAVDRMVSESAKNGSVDVLKWFTFLATDVIGQLSFGESFEMLEKGKDNQYTRDLKKNAFFGSMRYEFRGLVDIIAKLPIASVRDVVESYERMISYARTSIERYKSIPDSPPTLFSKLWKSVDAGSLTEQQIRSEARSYIIAGSDTTAVTLTYLVWAVSQQPELQQALAAEVNALPEDFTYDHVKELPLLNNVITEALRLYGAAPGSLPRIVPPGGRNLAGHHVPAGITASTQAFTLQRNQDIFPDPESFQPARWEKPTADMKSAMLPFGGGSRACVGINLAYMELRFATALFFRKSPTARYSSKAGAADMEIQNFFLISPKGRRCLMEM